VLQTTRLLPPVFLSWVSAASEISLPKFQVLISFVPSTGILSATFSGNGAATNSS
jgi:hypothetical protein